MPPPRIIPVIDIMGGQVVRAVGGRRSEYRPVQSVLTDSTEPGEVARALVAATGAEWLYLADLDAILYGRPDLASARAVAGIGVQTLYDCGYRSEGDHIRNSRLGFYLQCVVGTETGSLLLVSRLSPFWCGVSIDMRERQLLGDPAAWGGTSDPVEVAARAYDAGAAFLVLLDLARVGTGVGPGTESLVSAVKRRVPRANLVAGGGVRSWDDVRKLGDAGADAVLVASALHDGTLTLPRPTA
ncbi:HisA/HisF-related TIM barrel protein [Urbifossiella limnaea]|uniref:1-(5-phosphoribosyl)-5-[(5-phosphoribosylamino)methylideneamino] imidazole-4-carboxamide isomerase n=1 Tax=Urbifossiella limnaea TaxID=2528023 RepID=A0A517XSQ7_9BACT|nr:1-(5-phosphoribosyl)-5-[(5-phosphoribosylamino)methylideneamino] imidazole-4-carboxamide isomerase [Urbifossiella limnaea]